MQRHMCLGRPQITALVINLFKCIFLRINRQIHLDSFFVWMFIIYFLQCGQISNEELSMAWSVRPTATINNFRMILPNIFNFSCHF